jgi:short-subunit dehydrogenase
VLVAHDEERLRRTEETIRAATGADVSSVVCDIGRSDEIDAAAERLLAGGPVDVLVNNAGYGVYRAFEAEDADEIERLLAVNLVGHVRFTKRLLAPMIERRSGAISFVASIAGRVPITPNATYCAAKHGMFGLAEALRYELRRFGVEVTAVCPGRVETPFFDHPTFRERTRGPENKGAIGVERVGRAIVGAIERARPVTYVPGTLGVATWLYESLPLITKPLFSRVMGARIERLYADVTR